MTKGELARENFLRGDTCAQAVVAAFAAESEALGALAAAARPFGGGTGRLRLTCGAVSGAVMALGFLRPDLGKNELYALVQKFAARFREKNGSLICRELLEGAGVRADVSPNAEPRTETYYKKRPCPELVRDAADLLEELLGE